MPGQTVWEELESTLAGQLDLARRGEFDAVGDMMPRLGRLLDMLRDCPPTEELSALAQRVQRMYQELQLSLTAEKDEIGRRLAKLQHGRKALRAYRG